LLAEKARELGARAGVDMPADQQTLENGRVAAIRGAVSDSTQSHAASSSVDLREPQQVVILHTGMMLSAGREFNRPFYLSDSKFPAGLLT
jgi:hypothetical protein